MLKKILTFSLGIIILNAYHAVPIQCTLNWATKYSQTYPRKCALEQVCEFFKPTYRKSDLYFSPENIAIKGEVFRFF